jgi:hypothetical protein
VLKDLYPFDVWVENYVPPLDRLGRVLSLAPNLRSLDVGTDCNKPIPASCLRAALQVAGTKITSLALIVGLETFIPVIIVVAQMNSLCRLHLEIDSESDIWLPDCPFDDVPPLILPHLHYTKLTWFSIPDVGMLRWFARARFRQDCELHLMPVRMSEEESEALNPWFEAHHSRCVRIENTHLSERSSIMQHAQRVDFGQHTQVPPSLFASPTMMLPDYIRIFVRKNEGGMEFIRRIHRAIISSRADRWHESSLYIRTPDCFSWDSLSLENVTRPDTPFTRCVRDMDVDLRELGINVIDQAGYPSYPWLEDQWPTYEDDGTDGRIDSDTESETSEE